MTPPALAPFTGRCYVAGGFILRRRSDTFPRILKSLQAVVVHKCHVFGFRVNRLFTASTKACDPPGSKYTASHFVHTKAQIPETDTRIPLRSNSWVIVMQHRLHNESQQELRLLGAVSLSISLFVLSFRPWLRSACINQAGDPFHIMQGGVNSGSHRRGHLQRFGNPPSRWEMFS